MAYRKSEQETTWSANSELTVPYLISLLKEHILIILGIGLMTGLLTLAWNYVRLNDIYESRAVITPKSGRSTALDMMVSQLGAGAAGLGSLAGSLGAQNSELQQFIEVLRSERHLLTVVKKNKIGERLLEAPPSGDLDRYYANAVRELRGAVFSRADFSSLIIVSRTWDPVLSQDIVRAQLEAVQEFMSENIVTQSRNAEVFIKDRLKEARKDVDDAESYLASLTTGEFRPKGKSMEYEIARAKREFLRLNQLLDLLSQQYELAQIESKRDDPKFLVIEPPTKPLTPVGPKRIANALLGLIAGLLLAILGVVAVNRYQYLRAQGFI